MMNFIWFTNDIPVVFMFYYCSHKKRPKQSLSYTSDSYTFQQDSAPAHTTCKTPDFMPPCCLLLKLGTFFISEPEKKVYHQSRVATDGTSWDRQACTHDTLRRQHYIMTSKEYLTNSYFCLNILNSHFFSYIW